MDSNQPRSSPIPPPSGMPEFANRPPPSVVPPRPPVFHPTAGGSKIQSPSGNPFARPTPTLERSPLPKPTPPNFAPPPAYVTLPPAPVETRKPPSSIPLEARTETNKSPSPIPVQKPVEPVKTADVPLTPPSPQPVQASPPTSPAVLPTNEEKEEKVKAEERVDMTGGLVSWLTNKVAESKLLSDVAEKTKHGIEQVLTTLDPGMRGFLSDDGTVELYVVATDSDTVRAIKDGFERVFASVLIRAVPAATENLPPLVNGSAYALEMCGERSSRVFISKQVPASAPVLVMQPFIMQIENRQMTATRMLLEWKGNLVDSFSQLLPVDSKVMQVLEARQKADGKQAQDFSIPVSQAIKEVHSGPNPPFSELLENGAAALAQQFMSLTMEQTTASSP